MAIAANSEKYQKKGIETLWKLKLRNEENDIDGEEVESLEMWEIMWY